MGMVRQADHIEEHDHPDCHNCDLANEDYPHHAANSCCLSWPAFLAIHHFTVYPWPLCAEPLRPSTPPTSTPAPGRRRCSAVPCTASAESRSKFAPRCSGLPGVALTTAACPASTSS